MVSDSLHQTAKRALHFNVAHQKINRAARASLKRDGIAAALQLVTRYRRGQSYSKKLDSKKLAEVAANQTRRDLPS